MLNARTMAASADTLPGDPAMRNAMLVLLTGRNIVRLE